MNFYQNLTLVLVLVHNILIFILKNTYIFVFWRFLRFFRLKFAKSVSAIFYFESPFLLAPSSESTIPDLSASCAEIYTEFNQNISYVAQYAYIYYDITTITQIPMYFYF